MQQMESHLLLAMNVHSLYANLTMSTKEEREIEHVLNGKPYTSTSKVSLPCFYKIVNFVSYYTWQYLIL